MNTTAPTQVPRWVTHVLVPVSNLVVAFVIAGIIIAMIGEGWCFALTTLTYGAVITSLLLMRFEPRPPHAKTDPWEDLKAGFS